MKSLIVNSILLICFLLHTANAQDSLKKVRKNEIGINIGPAALFMLGAEPYGQIPSITYKRALNNRVFLRAQLAFTMNKPTSLSNILSMRDFFVYHIALSHKVKHSFYC